MAWRIHDSVVRGEIDNRQKGVVRGRIWLAGQAEPVVLELAGNACADLAGCRLTFANQVEPVPLPKGARLASLQRGRIGELTASRKARVFDVPLDEALALSRRGEQPPERLANWLYLEWFSEANGRVVIESADYRLEISPPEWRLTSQDELQRQADAAAEWQGFMERLNQAVDQHQQQAPAPDREWDEHDHERLLRESDARTDKYMELLDKHGHSDEAHEKIAAEMGWNKELTEEEAAEQARWIEELNAAAQEALNEPEPEPDPLREGIDWVRDAKGDIKHPLQDRCSEAARKYWRRCRELGLGKSSDDDLATFLSEYQITGAKLAGALGSIARGGCPPDPALTVACLKRALDHLHRSQAGLEALAARRPPLLPAPLVTEARRDLFALREELLRLMQEWRDRGGRG